HLEPPNVLCCGTKGYHFGRPRSMQSSEALKTTHAAGGYGCTLLSGMIAPWNLVSVCFALKSLAADRRENAKSARLRSASTRSAWKRSAPCNTAPARLALRMLA